MASIVPIDNPDDPRLALFRETRDGDALRRAGVFLGEGMLVLERMLGRDARFGARALLVDERRLDDVSARLERAERNLGEDFPVFVARAGVIESLIGFRFHQGVLALGERGATLDAHAAVDALDLRDGALATIVALENLVDHDNIGSVFRNVAGFGGGCVLLSPSCGDPLYRKSVRTSMGHILRVPFGRFEERAWPGGLNALRARGFVVVALTPGEGATDIDTFARTLAPNRRLALMLGSEGPGLSNPALRAADARVSIPMAAGADSINVAAALAVALHALRSR